MRIGLWGALLSLCFLGIHCGEGNDNNEDEAIDDDDSSDDDDDTSNDDDDSSDDDDDSSDDDDDTTDDDDDTSNDDDDSSDDDDDTTGDDDDTSDDDDDDTDECTAIPPSGAWCQACNPTVTNSCSDGLVCISVDGENGWCATECCDLGAVDETYCTNQTSGLEECAFFSDIDSGLEAPPYYCVIVCVTQNDCPEGVACIEVQAGTSICAGFAEVDIDAGLEDSGPEDAGAEDAGPSGYEGQCPGGDGCITCSPDPPTTCDDFDNMGTTGLVGCCSVDGNDYYGTGMVECEAVDHGTCTAGCCFGTYQGAPAHVCCGQSS